MTGIVDWNRGDAGADGLALATEVAVITQRAALLRPVTAGVRSILAQGVDVLEYFTLATEETTGVLEQDGTAAGRINLLADPDDTTNGDLYEVHCSGSVAAPNGSIVEFQIVVFDNGLELTTDRPAQQVLCLGNGAGVAFAMHGFLRGPTSSPTPVAGFETVYTTTPGLTLHFSDLSFTVSRAYVATP